MPTQKLKQIIVITILFFLTTSCKQNSLRKISPDQYYDLLMQKIEEDDTSFHSETIIKDFEGNVISKDYLIQNYGVDTIGFDRYVDENDNLKLMVMRPITKKDIEANQKWDSLLVYNRQFLLKSLKFHEIDSSERPDIIGSYDYKLPLKTFPVNCDSTYEYLSMAFESDQRVRQNKQRDLYEKTDRKNQELLLSIIEQCGYDNIEASGSNAVHAAFMIIQHSEYEMQKKYFPIFEKWTFKGLLGPGTLALMIDRIRVGEGEKQLFGSQVRYTDSGKPEVEPIENPECVNVRRDSVGLEPLEDYLLRFGIEM